MVSVSTVVLVAYATAGILTLPFVWLFWNQDVRGNRYMAVIMVGAFVTTLTYTLTLVVDGLTATLVWYYVYLIALSINAMFFVGLALVWTNRREYLRLTLLGPITAALASVPLVGLVGLVVTGETFGGLIWADPALTHLGSLTVFDRTPGPLVLLWRLAATGMIVAMLVLFGEFTIRPEQRLYRTQNALMIAGALSVVILAIAAQLAGVPIELTPVAYLMTASIFAVAIKRYGYFDVVPLATNSIVEELDAGVLVYDTSGRVLDANGTAEEMLGVPCEPGTDLRELVTEATVPETSVAEVDGLDELESVLDGQEFTGSMDGQERRISISTSTVRGASDAVVGHGLLLYDVTERHRREQRLERQTAQLDQFASVVSHDLRNPLGIAQTYLDFARDTCDPDDFDAVEEALDRMDTMIADLLTMARAETIVDETEPVDLDRLVSETWRTARTDGATLQVQTDGASIDGNPDLLRNVFENLFRNAVDHNDPPITVTVATLEDRPGFYIEDNGTGVPEDQRGAIFEYGHSTAEEGTGFGLSIVQDLVEAHGWVITVTDGTESGARFEIETD